MIDEHALSSQVCLDNGDLRCASKPQSFPGKEATTKEDSEITLWGSRLDWCKYSIVRLSTGKNPTVAPYSGAMLAMVYVRQHTTVRFFDNNLQLPETYSTISQRQLRHSRAEELDKLVNDALFSQLFRKSSSTPSSPQQQKP